MKRTLMAVAVAGVFVSPTMAIAQASTVTLYGLLNVSFESVESDGGATAALPRRSRVSTNTGSHVGFRGTEKLGTDLEAWFQLESNAPVDIGGGTFGSRNSAVGLRGNAWGSILLGQWDTPYKTATTRLDANYTTIASYIGTAHGNGGGTAGNVTNRFGFDRRQQNSIQYWSPTVSGFSVRAAYGANEERSATINPHLISTSVIWQGGPFLVGIAHEQHKQYGAANGKDKATQIFAQAAFGSFTLGLMGEQLKWQGFAVATPSYKGSVLPSSAGGGLEVNDWFASARWKSGNNEFALGYGWDQKVKLNGRDESSRKARQISLRFGHDFSKRSQVYAMVTRLDNKDASSNAFGFNAVGAGAAGLDSRGVGIGLIHRF